MTTRFSKTILSSINRRREKRNIHSSQNQAFPSRHPQKNSISARWVQLTIILSWLKKVCATTSIKSSKPKRRIWIVFSFLDYPIIMKWKTSQVVRLERLELSPGKPTWPSTKPVYQFQHNRICVRINEWQFIRKLIDIIYGIK